MMQFDINAGVVGLILAIIGLVYNAISMVNAWRSGRALDSLQQAVKDLNNGAIQQILDQQRQLVDSQLQFPNGRPMSASPLNVAVPTRISSSSSESTAQ